MKRISRHQSVQSRRLASVSAALLLSTSLATAASAADAGNLQLDEIIVTATKTGETALQSTPLAITAFSGAQLESRGVTGVRGLVDYTPGLQIAEQSGYAPALYPRHRFQQRLRRVRPQFHNAYGRCLSRAALVLLLGLS